MNWGCISTSLCIIYLIEDSRVGILGWLFFFYFLFGVNLPPPIQADYLLFMCLFYYLFTILLFYFTIYVLILLFTIYLLLFTIHVLILGGCPIEKRAKNLSPFFYFIVFIEMLRFPQNDFVACHYDLGIMFQDEEMV